MAIYDRIDKIFNVIKFDLISFQGSVSQHDRRLDGILKTSYLLIMISLSLCKPKTISLLVNGLN